MNAAAMEDDAYMNGKILWQDSATLFCRKEYDVNRFLTEWERAEISGAVVIRRLAKDKEGRECGNCTVYLKPGVSCVNGAVYTGGIICAAGDRLMPGITEEMPTDGGLAIQSVSERTQGNAARYLKLTAK